MELASQPQVRRLHTFSIKRFSYTLHIPLFSYFKLLNANRTTVLHAHS